MNVYKITSNRYRQQGVFSIELAIAAPLIAMILVFLTDMVTKQSLKGRLNVAAYSAVSIMKERVVLYSESLESLADVNVKVTKPQAKLMFELVKASLARTASNLDLERMSYHLEQQKFDLKDEALIPHPVVEFSGAGSKAERDCWPPQRLREMTALHIETGWSRPLSLYQVTLCYKDNNGFGSLIGGNFSLIKANAIMPGR